MSELDEMVFGKNLKSLEKELEFQLKMGESLGGTICSNIVYHIEKKKGMLNK